MGITILLLKYLTHPKERGFYCNDTSIRYPYHSSTVTTTVNNCVSYGIPLLIIIVKNIAQKPTLNTSKRTALIRDLIIRDISLFLFGVFTVQVYDLSQRFITHYYKIHWKSFNFINQSRRHKETVGARIRLTTKTWAGQKMREIVSL